MTMKIFLSIAGIIVTGFFFSAFKQKPDSIHSVRSMGITIDSVRQMTHRTFIKEVYDYRRKSTPWLFKGTKPAVIVLYAYWCSPCKQMAPIIKELAAEYGNRIQFYQVNIDKEKDLMNFFKANYIPMFVLIPIKDEPQKYCGAMNKDILKRKIDEILLSK
jgi:thioredoxin 1